MQCSEIFKSALRLLNEKGAEDECADYAERAPYLLAAMVSEAAQLDKRYRAANGEEAQPSFSPVFIGLDSGFPLTDRFVSAAAFYLASMLIIDDNDELSDSLYEKFCDRMASLSSKAPAVPAELHKTKNVY